jgi:oligoribonuclease NrnB/cAMP/cGMP phosphodiesterase (DHH superfamily)
VKGSDILTIFNKDVADLFKHRHPIHSAGQDGLAVNTNPKYSSELGHRLATESGTFGCTYSYSGADKKWWYQLRSNGDFDVSKIAKFYDGGGHKNAAGFSNKFLIGF